MSKYDKIPNYRSDTSCIFCKFSKYIDVVIDVIKCYKYDVIVENHNTCDSFSYDGEPW